MSKEWLPLFYIIFQYEGIEEEKEGLGKMIWEDKHTGYAQKKTSGLQSSDRGYQIGHSDIGQFYQKD